MPRYDVRRVLAMRNASAGTSSHAGTLGSASSHCTFPFLSRTSGVMDEVGCEKVRRRASKRSFTSPATCSGVLRIGTRCTCAYARYASVGSSVGGHDGRLGRTSIRERAVHIPSAFSHRKKSAAADACAGPACALAMRSAPRTSAAAHCSSCASHKVDISRAAGACVRRALYVRRRPTRFSSPSTRRTCRSKRRIARATSSTGLPISAAIASGRHREWRASA